MRSYPAKILLFGEHVVLLGAPALAVPVPAFSGRWAWREPAAEPAAHDLRLREFAASTAMAAVPGLDVPAFGQDLERGLFFDSNIPAGYGLGSSGALCAAVYDRYVPEKTTDLTALKSIFAGLESFFHGSSSGIDPLTSYLDKPLIVRNQNEVVTDDWPHWQGGEPVIFLLDSGMPRQTGPLVTWFRERCREPEFATFLREKYLGFHSAALRAWENSDAPQFLRQMALIAQAQHRYMLPMFPAHLRDEIAVESRAVMFKLCGAGGGGFVLGLSGSRASVDAIAARKPVIFPFEKNTSAHENAA